MMPEISIIVPVYNVEEYLPKCLESILGQTFVDFELILVNDGSTDNSGSICEKFLKKDQRIKLIHQVNRGLSNARNAGIVMAKGKFFSFIDSDDWIEKNMLFEMHDQLIKSNADIVIAGHFVVNLDGSIEEKNNVKATRVLDRISATSLILLDEEINSFAWDKLYRRALFDNLRYPENRLFEDTATTYKLFNKASKLIQMNKAYYFYQRRESGICLNQEFSKVVKRNYDNYLAFQERYEFATSNDDFLSVADACQAKAFIHGQQLLHFIVKNKLDPKNSSFKPILKKLSEMKISCNKHLSIAHKLEQRLMKISTCIYAAFLRTYYYGLLLID
jgi:glycosyltransferase involved in cell wall biosynthesis